jgi:decaprenylphospho-beta-D-ribofuranose 2-oxidase
VTVEDILRHFVPRGFFPPVTPGTKFVTLGGAMACDIHGKNHHRDGACRHALSFQLLCASGDTLSCTRIENADVFWATLGGMG